MTAKPPRDLRGIALDVGAVLVFTAVATAATFGLAMAFGVEFDDLSRDPTTVYKGPVYAGWFSNLVVLLWQVPVTCALLTAAVLRSTRRGDAAMFLVAGLLTGVFVADDVFLLHEFLDEAIRLPQLVLPVVYGVAVLVFVWVFRRALRTELVLVALALLCWTGAVATTALANQHGQMVVSAAKLAGVAFWALLIVRLALAALREGVVVAEDGQDAPDEAPAVEEPAAVPVAAVPAPPAAAASVAEAPPPAEEAPAPAPAPASAPAPAPAPLPAAIPAPAPPAAPVPAAMPAPVPASPPRPAPAPVLAAPAVAVPAEPATALNPVVPPAPVRRDPYAEAETGPVPVTLQDDPDDTSTVAQPVVPPVPAGAATGPPAPGPLGRRRRLDQEPPDRRPHPPAEQGQQLPPPRPEHQRPRHRRI